MGEDDDRLYAIVASDRRVDAQSARRLSFEPKGWQVDFHRELRSALRAMTPPARGPLRCVYSSDDRALVDIENVLTYNVGTSNLGHLVTAGLVLERSFDAPSPLDGLTHPHLLSYQFDPDPSVEWAHWEPAQLLASISVDRWDWFRDHRVGDAWLRARAHTVDVSPSDVTPREFGAIVTVTSSGPANLLSALKPMLDGLIASLHRYSGPHTEVLAERAAFLSPAVGLTGLRNALTDPRDRPLGPWPWLIPRGQGVQVSPADDRLVALTVRLKRGAPAVDASFVAVTHRTNRSRPEPG